MGKIRYAIFSVIFCFFMMPILAACGETGVHLNSISSEKVSYSVVQGSEVKLEINFSPKEATNKKLSYKIASGEEYVSVDDNGVVKALVVEDKSEHDAKIVVIPDYNSNMKIVCRVKILGEKIKLDAPNGLTYSVKDRALVWNKVEYISRDETDGVELINYNPCYTLKIAEGENASLEDATLYEVDRNLEYPITKAGTYSAFIKSTSDEESTFASSDYSERYVFTILDAPNDVLIEDNEIRTEIKSVENFEVAEDNYELNIVGHDELKASFEKSTKVIDSKNYVCWTIPNKENSLNVGEYEFQIIFKGDGQRFFDSSYSQKHKFVQLDKLTSLTLAGDVVSWDKNNMASSYTVLVEAKGQVQTINLRGQKVYGYDSEGSPTTTSEPVDFANFETHRGYYYNNNGVFVKITESTYNEENDTLVLGEDNSEESFSYVCEENEFTLPAEVTKYAKYTVKVRANGNGHEILNGLYNEVESVKLGAVKSLSASTDGAYVRLEWEKIPLASVYEIYLNGEKFTQTSANYYSFRDDYQFTDNDITFKDGNNEIYIVAACNNTSYSNSNPSNVLMFEKLENPSLSTLNGNIAWESVSNATGYDITICTKNEEDEKVILANQSVDSEITTYSLRDDWASGEYFVSVRAKGDNLFIRSADEPESVSFTKQGAPQNLSLDKDGVLSWQAGANGSAYSEYEITLHNTNKVSTQDDIVFLASSASQSSPVSNYLPKEGFGEYSCYVRAVNNDSSSKFLNSNKSETAWFYRFETPTKNSNSDLNLRILNGGFVWDSVSTKNSQMDALIEGKFVYSLQVGNNPEIDVSDCVYVPKEEDCNSGLNLVKISVKTNSEENYINYNGHKMFLLSSNQSDVYRFEKLITPNTPRLVNGEVVGERVSGASDYALVLTKDAVGTSSEPQEYKITANESSWSKLVAELVPEEASGGRYSIKVRALGGDQYINSNFTTGELNLCKLSVPENVKLDDQRRVISWDRVIEDGLEVSEYAIKYRKLVSGGSAGPWMIERVTANFWDATNLDAGKYQFAVKSVAGRLESYEILPSAFQDVPTSVVKLNEVNYSSIKVLDDQLNKTYNTITWDAIKDENGNAYTDGAINYVVSISNRFSTGNNFIREEITDTNEFKFPDTYNGEHYAITIQAIKSGALPSSVPANEFYVNRLKMPTNLNIFEDSYKFGWSEVTYNYNGETKTAIYDLVDTFTDPSGEASTSTREENNGVSLLDNTDYRAGKHEIGIMAKIRGTDLSQEQGAVTISSATTAKYTFTKLEAPQIWVNNGEIVWYNKNSVNYGYSLNFTPTAGQPINITQSAGDYHYDMSDERFSSGLVQYDVSITALGSYSNSHVNGIYVPSDNSSLDNPVKKLTSPQFKVEDGVVKWDAIENARDYEVEIVSEDSLNEIQTTSSCVMPQSLIRGKTNEIKFTLKTYASNLSSDIYYINSNKSQVFKVNKWARPTGVCVIDGEIDWARIDAGDEYGSRGEVKFTGYSVKYGDSNEEILAGREDSFVLSELVDSKQTLNVSVCIKGATGSYEGIWINSDYSDPMTVSIMGVPRMYVKDGYLSWDENSSDTTSYDDYELLVNGSLRIELSSDESYFRRTLLTMDELSNEEEIQSVKIRHKGTERSSGDGMIYYVNSRYSNVVNNIRKLSQINAMRVDENGNLAWQQNSGQDSSEAINYATILFNGDEADKSTTRYNYNSATGASTFDLSFMQIEMSNSYENVRVIYWTNGTASVTDEEDLESSEQKLLRSESNEIVVTRFKEVDDFRMSADGLKIEWDYRQIQVNAKANDKFIISYKFAPKNDPSNFGDLQTFEIVVDNSMKSSINSTTTASIPLWDLGNYQFSIQTYSTASNVIKSASKTMTYVVAGENFVRFDKFYGGNGSISNPFIIKSITQNGFYSKDISATEQFNFVKKLSDKYFVLEEDIDLSQNSVSESSASNYWVNPIESYGFGNGFSGGIDGNGHTIKNYRVFRGADSAALFNYVVGEDVAGATSNNFSSRKGIIKNLTLEVDSFEYSQNYNHISFLCEESLGGWFVNCKLEMSESLRNSGGINLELTAITSVYYGGMVGVLQTSIGAAQKEIRLDGTTIYPRASTENGISFSSVASPIGYYYINDGEFVEITNTNYNSESHYLTVNLKLDNSYLNRNACLVGCSSNLDVKLLGANSNLSCVTMIGGLVYRNLGGRLLNCKNLGDLSAVQVGGICCESTSYIAYSYNGSSWSNPEQISSVFNGCENRGTLSSYALNNTSQNSSKSGGILAWTNNAYVVNCINYGNMHSATQDLAASSTVGGVVGVNSNGTLHIINCMFVGEFTKEDNITSSFYGILANSTGTLSVYDCYYYDCYEDAGFSVGGVYGVNLTCAKTEDELKAGNLNFLSFGTISGDYLTINPTVNYIFNGQTYTITTSLLYNAFVKQINLIYQNNGDYPILKTYIISNI
ncbi:MAG: hypothetical protein IJ837_03890 [Clostridia bacterium]|nr:hypothetical protein [Clostridia bacterium]